MSLNGIEQPRPHVVHEGLHELRPKCERLAARPSLTESQRRLFYEIPKRYRRKARWWFRR